MTIPRADHLEAAEQLCLGTLHDPLLHGPGVLGLIDSIDESIPSGVTLPVREALLFAYLRALDDLMHWTPTEGMGCQFGDRNSKSDRQLQLYCKLHFSTR